MIRQGCCVALAKAEHTHRAPGGAVKPTNLLCHEGSRGKLTLHIFAMRAPVSLLAFVAGFAALSAAQNLPLPAMVRPHACICQAAQDESPGCCRVGGARRCQQSWFS
jgi:hypothetical protein